MIEFQFLVVIEDRTHWPVEIRRVHNTACLPGGGNKQYSANVLGHSIEIANHSVRYKKISTLCGLSQVTGALLQDSMRLSFRLSLGTRFGTQGSFKTGSSLVFKRGLSLPRRAIKILPKLVSQLSRGLKKNTVVANCRSRLERLVKQPTVRFSFRDSIAIRITCESLS